jgi:hypothetical protein
MVRWFGSRRQSGIHLKFSRCPTVLCYEMTDQKMKKDRVIKFDSKERILQRARSYVESVETFFDESDRAIPLLLKAMKLADRDLKREIMLLLKWAAQSFQTGNESKE